MMFLSCFGGGSEGLRMFRSCNGVSVIRRVSQSCFRHVLGGVSHRVPSVNTCVVAGNKGSC